MPQNQAVESIPNTSGKNYGVELYTVGLDNSELPAYVNRKPPNISKYISTVRVIHSIDSIWPQIFVNVMVNSEEIILGSIYGQNDLTLLLSTNDDTGENLERLAFSLLYLQSNVALIPKGQQSSDTATFQTITIACIPLLSYNLMMNSFHNFVLEEDTINRSSIQIIEDELKKKKYTNYEIDKRGSSTIYFDQLVVPPCNLSKMIDYIDQRNPIYGGPFLKFCDSSGKFMLWKYSERLKRSKPIMKIYQIPTHETDRKKIDSIINSSLDGYHFYTRDPIETLYNGNASIIKYGYNNVYIQHPSNGLYQLLPDTQLKNLLTHGLSDKQNEVKHHAYINETKKYIHTDIFNFENDDTECKVLRNYDSSKTSRIRVTIYGNIIMTTVMKVGEPVIFEPLIEEYIEEYGGVYIIESSDFIISRTDTYNWSTRCTLTLVRTNCLKAD